MDFADSSPVMNRRRIDAAARPSSRRQVARMRTSGRFLRASKGAISRRREQAFVENALSTAAAVDVVVARWMHLKILTGFVCHCELKGGHGQRLAAPTNSFV